LARLQAERVQGWQHERGQSFELVPMHTEGDRILDRSLAEIGGKGLFVKELEQALSEGRADLAVHSAKDVPYALPEGFTLSAFPLREDPRDALVAPLAKTFANLPRGARVGTSSLRRAVQLLAERPDLKIVPVRGNVQSRLARDTGAAGVRAVRAARARRAGCGTVPVAAYAVMEEDQGIWLRAVRGGPDGHGGVKLVRAELRGPAAQPEPLGKSVAEVLLDKGGAPLLEAARSQAEGLPAPKRA